MSYNNLVVRYFIQLNKKVIKMAKLAPISALIRSVVEKAVEYPADFYFIDARAKGKRYKFWQILPDEQKLAQINEDFNKLGVNVHAEVINRGKWEKERCLSVMVGYEHANLSQVELASLAK
jgi:hypothetical protein